jgi:hypothetical protein
MSRYVNILKLCVGVDEVSELVAWQRRRLDERRRAKQPLELYHRTRQVPKRADEVVAGGSLYWIIKHRLVARQAILDFATSPRDGRTIVRLAPELVRVRLQAMRAHQGWRYLDGADAPADLEGEPDGIDAMPPALLGKLAGLALL